MNAVEIEIAVSNLAQEPFAWLYRDSWGPMKLSQGMPPPVGAFPVYTAPPRREWVGLTDEEKSDLWCESTGRDCVNEDTHVFADSIEAKLRKKNQ